jgi:hypothetical protein
MTSQSQECIEDGLIIGSVGRRSRVVHPEEHSQVFDDFLKTMLARVFGGVVKGLHPWCDTIMKEELGREILQSWKEVRGRKLGNLILQQHPHQTEVQKVSYCRHYS